MKEIERTFHARFLGLGPVRVLKDSAGNVWMPVADVARAIGTKENSLRVIILRDPEFFEGDIARRMMPVLQTVLTMCEAQTDPKREIVAVTLRHGNNSSDRRPKEHLLVSREGLIALLFSVHRKRLKNPDASEKILQFKKWAVKTLVRIMEGRRLTEGDAWPSEYEDILSIPSRFDRGEAVLKLAREQGVSRTTAYRRYGAALDTFGVPRRRTSCKGWKRSLTIDQRRQVREYVKASSVDEGSGGLGEDAGLGPRRSLPSGRQVREALNLKVYPTAIENFLKEIPA